MVTCPLFIWTKYMVQAQNILPVEILYLKVYGAKKRNNAYPWKTTTSTYWLGCTQLKFPVKVEGSSTLVWKFSDMQTEDWNSMAWQPPLPSPPPAEWILLMAALLYKAERRQMDTDQKAKHQPGGMMGMRAGNWRGRPARWTGRTVCRTTRILLYF